MTTEAKGYEQGVGAELDDQMEALRGSLPDVSVGPHCHEPRACPFLERCWPQDRDHIIKLCQVGPKKAAKYMARGVHRILPGHSRNSRAPTARRSSHPVLVLSFSARVAVLWSEVDPVPYRVRDPWGRSRSINPYAGRRFERRFEAADHPFADRPAVWHHRARPGYPRMARATAQAAKSGTRPSQVTVVQPQSSQRHTEPLARTWKRRFRAHARRC